MRHLFLTERWIYACQLPLSHIRLIDFLNTRKKFVVLENAEMELWLPPTTSGYRYQMHHTVLSTSSIILAHETKDRDPTAKAALYEKRISRKIPPYRYEFHLLNGLILTGYALLKKDELTLTQPFVAVLDFHLRTCRPDDPRGDCMDYASFPPLAGLDYVILNTAWVQHFHKLLPHELLLWYEEEGLTPP